MSASTLPDSPATAVTPPEAARKAMERLGRQIAGARVERNMSQEDLSEAAEVTRKRVSQIENATGSTRFDSFLRAAHAVGLEVVLRPIT